MSPKGPKQTPVFDPSKFSAHDAISEAVRLNHDDIKIIEMLRTHFKEDTEGVTDRLIVTIIAERRARLGLPTREDHY